MNEQELRQLSASKNIEQAIAAVASLTEEQREELAPTSLELLKRHVSVQSYNPIRHSLLERGDGIGLIGFLPHDRSDPVGHEICKLAVLATCSISEIKKLSYSGMPEPDGALKILTDRKPSWIDTWCRFALTVTGATHWLAVYRLEQILGCIVDHDSLYFTGMCAGLTLQTDMTDLIWNEAVIRDDYIWTMFADSACSEFLCHPERIIYEDWARGIQGRPPVRLQQEAFSRITTNAWLNCLGQLVEQKVIDRERTKSLVFTYLGACVDGEEKVSIRATFSDDRVLTGAWQNQTDFAIALAHCCLKGNWDDCKNELAVLCGAVNSKVAVFALKALLELSPMELPTHVILSNISGALRNKWKKPAELALDLLASFATTASTDRAELAEVISVAFENKSKSIHSKALTLLEKMQPDVLLNELASMEHRMANLKGFERQRANDLFERARVSQAPATLTGEPLGVINFETQTRETELLIERAESWRGSSFFNTMHLEQTLNDLRENTLPELSPVNLWLYDFPRLDPGGKLMPIDNEDDLVFAFAQLLEGCSAPLDRERVMDAVSRLCSSPSADFEQKTQVLKQKIDKTLGASAQNFTDDVRPWHNLVRAYLQTNVGEGHWPHDFFLEQRICELCVRVTDRQAAPLLAAPTHINGWIEPRTLVLRLMEWQEKILPLDRADFIQAILRLAPEGRAEALETAQDLTGLAGEVIRYALGGADFNPKEKLSLWIAAFRSREPYSDSPELEILAPGLPPDAAIAAEYSFDAEEIYKSVVYELPNLLPVQSFDPEFPQSRAKARKRGRIFGELMKDIGIREKYGLLPTCLLHDNASPFARSLMPNVWPQNRESYLAILSKRIANREWKMAPYELDVLFHPDQPMTGNAKWWLAYALGVTDDKTAATAADLLISVISETRLSPTLLAEPMTQFVILGETKHSIFVKSFREVARISALHSYFCFEAACAFVQGIYPKMSANAKIGWFEFLLDVQAEFGFSLPSETMVILQGDKSSGKVGKLATKLHTYTKGTNAQTRLAVAQTWLIGKLDRLERWQRWTAGNASGP